MSTAMVYIMRKHLAWDPRVRGNHFLESSYHDNLRTIEMYILDGKWPRWLIPFLSSTKMADKDVAALIRLRRPKSIPYMVIPRRFRYTWAAMNDVHLGKLPSSLRPIDVYTNVYLRDIIYYSTFEMALNDVR